MKTKILIPLLLFLLTLSSVAQTTLDTILRFDNNYKRSQLDYSKKFIIKPDTNGKLIIIKPDTSLKYYLRILPKDPSKHFTTIQGLPPTILIDGEVSMYGLSGLDPKDIYSISIIKDKKMLESFGETGKNGLISVTTKKKTEEDLEKHK